MKIFFAVITSLFLIRPVGIDTNNIDLYVDASNIVAEVSPYAYGANYGPLQTVPADLLEEAARSGINYLRFPAGRWGDLNDIRPQQIDMLMLVREWVGGADVNISVRLENGTPEAAAELVRYTNIEKEYGVRYWAIGNEPNLFDDYTTEQHNREWRAIAEAMLAVDPTIQLMGPDTSQYTGLPGRDPVDETGRNWVDEFLIANGDLVDIVTVHRYPFPRGMGADDIQPSVGDLRGNVDEWTGIVERLRQRTIELTERDLPIGITEANSNWSGAIGGEGTPDGHYNAIWWGDVLGRLLYQEPMFVGYFDLQSTNSRGGWGLFASYEVRPTYYVYQLYQQFGDQLVQVNTDSDWLRIYAAQRADGALTLIVSNLADEPQEALLTIDNLAGRHSADVIRLDAEHNADLIETLQISGNDLITVPAQTLTLYVIE